MKAFQAGRWCENITGFFMAYYPGFGIDLPGFYLGITRRDVPGQIRKRESADNYKCHKGLQAAAIKKVKSVMMFQYNRTTNKLASAKDRICMGAIQG